MKFILKAGYDPEDMFHTNQEKFQTTTDFDESKYTYVLLVLLKILFENFFFRRNVPVRQMSATESAEVEKKVQEIEKRIRTDEVDEDDAGNKKICNMIN